MSFDLFFGCFHLGQKASFPRNLLDEHFGPYISRRESTCFTVDFGDAGTSHVYCDEDDRIDGFSVNRPVAAAALYQAIFELLRTEPLVLVMPGKCPPLIGSAETAPHVPADMVDALGNPVVVQSPGEILQWIHQA
jgi:hypothetical protein